jgi:hypothetical protein
VLGPPPIYTVIRKKFGLEAQPKLNHENDEVRRERSELCSRAER